MKLLVDFICIAVIGAMLCWPVFILSTPMTEPISVATQPSNEILVPTQPPLSAFTPTTSQPCAAWRGIVLHHSAADNSTVDSIRRHHVEVNGWDDIGYHFIVFVDGHIYATDRWKKQKAGAHCKGHNDTIGICLIGALHEHAPTPEQLVMAKELVAFLRGQFNLPSDSIWGHGDLGKTECPGKFVSIDEFRR